MEEAGSGSRVRWSRSRGGQMCRRQGRGLPDLEGPRSGRPEPSSLETTKTADDEEGAGVEEYALSVDVVVILFSGPVGEWPSGDG